MLLYRLFEAKQRLAFNSIFHFRLKAVNIEIILVKPIPHQFF